MPVTAKDFARSVGQLRQITNVMVQRGATPYSLLFLLHGNQALCTRLKGDEPDRDAWLEVLSLAEAEVFDVALIIYHVSLDTPAAPPAGIAVMGQCLVEMGRADPGPIGNCSPFILDSRARRAYFIDNLDTPTFTANLEDDAWMATVGRELRQRFDNAPTGALSAKVKRLESMGHTCRLIEY